VLEVKGGLLEQSWRKQFLEEKPGRLIPIVADQSGMAIALLGYNGQQSCLAVLIP